MDSLVSVDFGSEFAPLISWGFINTVREYANIGMDRIGAVDSCEMKELFSVSFLSPCL